MSFVWASSNNSFSFVTRHKIYSLLTILSRNFGSFSKSQGPSCNIAGPFGLRNFRLLPCWHIDKKKNDGKEKKIFSKRNNNSTPPPTHTLCRNIFFNINKIHWTIMLISLPTTIKSGGWLGRVGSWFTHVFFPFMLLTEKRNKKKQIKIRLNSSPYRYLFVSHFHGNFFPSTVPGDIKESKIFNFGRLFF